MPGVRRGMPSRRCAAIALPRWTRTPNEAAFPRGPWQQGLQSCFLELWDSRRPPAIGTATFQTTFIGNWFRNASEVEHPLKFARFRNTA